MRRKGPNHRRKDKDFSPHRYSEEYGRWRLALKENRPGEVEAASRAWAKRFRRA